eukprot:TRINITY_DN6099_c0_g1_i1.p1 TRINITY_DN6099_c0_g1~~TRINITY_DN6099_c0_g1_i1.p1  ORF type:complete len:186 (+),score=63.28 TRINITY_DN6099_c0_g1_i1:280-837(+)
MGNRKHELFSSQTYMGNRHSEQYHQSSYHDHCNDLTSDWQQWETGTSGAIRIKRGKQDSVDKSWEVDMEFDRPVENLEIYNGVADTASGSKFKVTPTTWNTRFAVGEEVTVNFKATFKENEPKPKLTALIINGKYHDCNPPKQPPTTRISSHPAWSSKVLGLYILLADDAEDGFESNAEWNPVTV